MKGITRINNHNPPSHLALKTHSSVHQVFSYTKYISAPPHPPLFSPILGSETL